jgi:hypothetical protein
LEGTAAAEALAARARMESLETMVKVESRFEVGGGEG